MMRRKVKNEDQIENNNNNGEFLELNDFQSKIKGKRKTRQMKPATVICFQHRSKAAEQLG
jgi:hypothetical protein